MSRIIAIDPSLTSTAVAHGTEKLPLLTMWRPKAKGAERLNEFYDLVDEHMPYDTRDVAVYIEGYSFSSRHSQAHALGELGGVLRLAYHRLSVPVTEVPPSTLKKFATGKGNASKAAMVSAVASRTGLEFDTDDAADALALYCLGRELRGLEHPMGQLPKTHLSALDKLQEADDA